MFIVVRNSSSSRVELFGELRSREDIAAGETKSQRAPCHDVV